MIVTLDGPAGAGKSSAARALAQRLGFEFLDTGAMYRAVTLAGLRAGIDLSNQDSLAHLLTNFRLEMNAGRVFVNDADVTEPIRAAEVTRASGILADSPLVREYLAGLQRALARGRNMVCEGRDQGTVVFPDAVCKFFLVADPVERARRRQREMAARGEVLSMDEVLAAQDDRDRHDEHRRLAPMVPAPEAILIDSTYLSLDQVVERLEREVRKSLIRSQGSEIREPDC
jgi:cytidylate kinase